MSGRGKPIPGFDYVGGRAVEKTRAEWRELAQTAHRVRVQDGETFLHGQDSRIFAEIYGYIGSIDHDQGGC